MEGDLSELNPVEMRNKVKHYVCKLKNGDVPADYTIDEVGLIQIAAGVVSGTPMALKEMKEIEDAARAS